MAAKSNDLTFSPTSLLRKNHYLCDMDCMHFEKKNDIANKYPSYLNFAFPSKANMKAFRSRGPLDSVRIYNKAKLPDNNVSFLWIKIIACRIDVWDDGLLFSAYSIAPRTENNNFLLDLPHVTWVYLHPC